MRDKPPLTTSHGFGLGIARRQAGHMSLPPYIVKEFTASSGNHARMKLWLQSEGQCKVADINWRTEGTEADKEEARQYILAVLTERFPQAEVVHTAEMTVNDTPLREEIIRQALIPGWARRN